jgi:hypothetical protein
MRSACLLDREVGEQDLVDLDVGLLAEVLEDRVLQLEAVLAVDEIRTTPRS